ncbi:MAG: 4a-hydroxytetrahydrobiopterin dehydratase [Hydrococcus sp. C42_A2020_068]|uniref:4a-hydroxytetrahydrobiopterin dehydratase n=1 Tax=Pleurocapsa sp. PCC 7327 TaxID=118163 RepID=UPI001186F0A3|nr:4a-hydroxytetrahydrobiopterin dehydratase [Pleurocapsa sp. PCC 7327]MBF2021463.1 4a-hydroxytetrahydrobiopterin dehydratase [Hydrococcus sp. C42_A2020_068]
MSLLRERVCHQESKARQLRRGNRVARSSSSQSPCGGTFRLLSSQELEAVLQELRGWSQTEGKLHRQFRFSCFEKALGFMSGLALVAEAMGHRPQESNIYDRVMVDLTTSEAGGITDLDVEIARKADELASQLKSLG